jgi:hypothetical protein
MDTNEFRKWVDDNDILNRTNLRFREFLNNFINEDWTENNPLALFTEDKIDVDIKEVSIKLKDLSKVSQNDICELVEVKLGMDYRGLFMGTFSLSYDLSGNEIDNELIWGLAFGAINQRISILEDLRGEFESNTLLEVLDSKSKEVIISIVDDKLRQMKECFK